MGERVIWITQDKVALNLDAEFHCMAKSESYIVHQTAWIFRSSQTQSVTLFRYGKIPSNY